MIKINISKFDQALHISIGLLLVCIGFMYTASIDDACLVDINTYPSA